MSNTFDPEKQKSPALLAVCFPIFKKDRKNVVLDPGFVSYTTAFKLNFGSQHEFLFLKSSKNCLWIYY